MFTMLLELVNSVFLTYLATEYLLVENHDHDHNSQTQTSRNRKNTAFLQLRAALSLFTSQHSRPCKFIFLVVLSVNLLVHFQATGKALAEWMHDKVERTHHFHISRIFAAMCSFLLALYWDCRQSYKLQYSKYETRSPGGAASSPPWSNRHFLQHLFHSFCKVLPIYPFLAVIISFGFLFIITAFERLNLPLQLLNTPIYYGTLYG